MNCLHFLYDTLCAGSECLLFMCVSTARCWRVTFGTMSAPNRLTAALSWTSHFYAILKPQFSKDKLTFIESVFSPGWCIESLSAHHPLALALKCLPSLHSAQHRSCRAPRRLSQPLLTESMWIPHKTLPHVFTSPKSNELPVLLTKPRPAPSTALYPISKRCGFECSFIALSLGETGRST